MSRAANLRSDTTKADAVARNRRGCEKNARTQIPGGIRATVHVETRCLAWTIIIAVISAAIEFVAVVAVAVAHDIVVDGIATVDVADADAVAAAVKYTPERSTHVHYHTCTQPWHT